MVIISSSFYSIYTLQKQYEAYLLRTYGQPRSNGSATADSGLESQNDQAISPSPMSVRSVQVIPKTAFIRINPEHNPWSPKVSGLDNQTVQKPKLTEIPTDIRSYFNLTPAQAAVPSFSQPAMASFPQSAIPSFSQPAIPSFSQPTIPSLYDEASDNFKYQNFLASLNDRRYQFTTKADPKPPETNLELTPIKGIVPSFAEDYNLDGYISKIKQQLHKDFAQPTNISQERDHSVEEPDHEQNTSGDLLNMTLSDDGFDVKSEEKAKKDTSKIRSSWLSLARTSGLHTPAEYCESLPQNAHTRVPVSEKRSESPAKDLVYAFPSSTPITDKFSRQQQQPPEIATIQQQQQQAILTRQPALTQEIPAEESTLNEGWKLIQQNRILLAAADEEDKKLQQIKDTLDQDLKDDTDECIEDDYDHTVDIDTWMPDDMEQGIEEVHVQDEIRDRPRRKLESIEEVEPLEDEDSADELEIKDGSSIQQDEERESIDSIHDNVLVEDAADAEAPKEQQPGYTDKIYAENVAEEYPSDQQYYEQDNNEEKQEEKPEYAENYQPAEAEEQQYQYPEDPNQQQYAYDENGQYPGYDNQLYAQEQYGQYADGQYEGYDPNQTYEQDPNQAYQQDPNQEYQQDPNQAYQQDPNQAYPQDPNQAYQYADYGEYQDRQYEQTEGTEEGQENQYEPTDAYDYSQEAQGYDTGATEVEQDNSQVKHNQEPVEDQALVRSEPEDNAPAAAAAVVTAPAAAAQVSKEPSKDTKRKKDLIASILDSDSESLIERNASNTESDYDFN